MYIVSVPDKKIVRQRFVRSAGRIVYIYLVLFFFFFFCNSYLGTVPTSLYLFARAFTRNTKKILTYM